MVGSSSSPTCQAVHTGTDPAQTIPASGAVQKSFWIADAVAGGDAGSLQGVKSYYDLLASWHVAALLLTDEVEFPWSPSRVCKRAEVTRSECSHQGLGGFPKSPAQALLSLLINCRDHTHIRL